MYISIDIYLYIYLNNTIKVQSSQCVLRAQEISCTAESSGFLFLTSWMCSVNFGLMAQLLEGDQNWWLTASVKIRSLLLKAHDLCHVCHGQVLTCCWRWKDYSQEMNMHTRHGKLTSNICLCVTVSLCNWSRKSGCPCGNYFLIFM